MSRTAPPAATARAAPGRRRRDRLADAGLVLFAAAFSLLTVDSVVQGSDVSAERLVAEQAAAGAACVALLLRRRWPVPLAVAMLVADSFGHFFIGPTLVALFTVAAHRPLRITGWVAALALGRLVVFLAGTPDPDLPQTTSGLAYFALVAAALGWGLFVRSRRQLVASLRERAEQAEADAALRAERAQRLAREEIAREMHDVLAHRLSLLSVHAGALEFNPGAPPGEIARAAGVIRDSAHRALQDLRDVIGVLRAPTAGGDGADGGGGEPGGGRPQPTLADVARLVAESRDAGMHITYAEEIAAPDTLPAATGRTVYRIVQEGLTNARKHAPGAGVAVSLTGGAQEGLTVELRNPVRPMRPVVAAGTATPGGRSAPGVRAAGPDAAPAAGADGAGRRGPGGQAGPGPVPPVPGAGQGLIGLAERAAHAGGRLEHALDADGFLLRAHLPWHRPGAPG